MSFLAPLFLLGGLAVTLPIIFHLIRRTPRRKISFGSVLFLENRELRTKRKRKLDHLILLALRILAFILIALAFARPLYQESIPLELNKPRRQVAILIDTSASMRRTGVFPRAVGEVRAFIKSLSPRDEAALYAYDRGIRKVLGFDKTLGAGQKEMILAALRKLKPSWKSTDLGNALVNLADELDESSGRTASPEILVISDFQNGSDLTALADYSWPKSVKLEAITVSPSQDGNVGIEILSDPAGKGRRDYRVRLTSDPGTPYEEMTLRWADSHHMLEPMNARVPAGESRVVRMPLPPKNFNADRLILGGDRQDFDNTIYIANATPRLKKVIYIGAENKNDPKEMRYYVERTLPLSLAYKMKIVSHEEAESTEKKLGDEGQPIMVITDPFLPGARRLPALLDKGGRALAVLKSAAAGTEINRILGSSLWTGTIEGSLNEYTMISKIDFTHPLFSAFADPRFSDFSKIHFWKYRVIRGYDRSRVKMIASFENGDPAILEAAVGPGILLIFTSGWHPSDSQFALSSKFLPFLLGFLENGENAGADYFVGDPIKTASGEANKPGIYSIRDERGLRKVAVNLRPAESRTESLTGTDLRAHGLIIGGGSGETKRLRLLNDTALEDQQKIWTWLLILALVLLFLETGLAGYWSRPAESVRP